MTARMEATHSQQSEAAIRATNDDAFASKLSALHKGYFQDEALLALSEQLQHTTRVPTRPPLINRGTATRVHVKNAIVQSFLSAVRKEGQTRAQIVSLGAGFDSLPFSLVGRLDDGLDVHVVEVDLPKVVKDKTGAVMRSLTLQGKFDSVKEVGDGDGGLDCFVRKTGDGSGYRYSLRGCDLREIDGLRTVLEETGMLAGVATLIVAEIVLVYLEACDSDRLIRTLERYFSGKRVFVNMEHMHPHDAFGVEMVRNIGSRGCALRGLERYPDVKSQRERFVGCGFEKVFAVSMYEAFERAFAGERRHRLDQVERLDEIEEWRLIMRHYCLVVAAAVEDGLDTERFLEAIVTQAFDEDDAVQQQR